MKKFNRNLKLVLALILCLGIEQASSQITVSTTSTFTNNNGSGTVTFNFENTNTTDIIITDIEGITGTAGTFSVDFWYKTTPINGAPGAISVANGWTQVATGTITGIANTTTTTTQSFFSGLNFTVPAGAMYGFAVSAYNGTAGVQRYHTIVAPNLPTVTMSAGGCNIITGANIGYGGGAPPTAPGNTPRGWLGSISFIPAIPCTAPPTAGLTVSNDSTVCPNSNFTLGLTGNTLASGLSYQWLSSSNNTTWTPITGATNLNFNTNQLANTYYRCVVTCNSVSDTSSSVLITTNTFVNCYCSSFPTSNAGSDIGNVAVASLNNGTAGAATNNPASTGTYTDFTTLPATTLTQGASYPISITQINSAGFTVNFATVHIDFDHDGIFDPVTETFAIGASTAAAGGNIISGNISIPFTALVGQTGMRVKLQAGGSATQSPCGTYGTGETEDYIVSIAAGAPCTAPPNAGITLSSLTAVCPNTSVTISLSGNSIGTGQTYVWESSPNGTNWTTVPGVSTTFFIATITNSIQYRCIVTCNGQSATSTPAVVSINPPSLCYCVTGLGGGNCGVNLVTTVSITGTTLNSVSADTCTFTTGNTLTVYPPSGATTATLIQGVTYDLNVTLSSSSIVSVWIDYDRDGIYAASEWQQVAVTSTAGTPNTIQITVPFTSGLGQTGMRIRSRGVGNTNGAPDACTNFGSGETEDYVITIIPNTPCAGTPTAGTTVASVVSACPNVPFSLSLSGNTLASGLTYQWQSSSNNVVWNSISGATNVGYTTSQVTDNYYRCIVNCGVASDTSTALLITTNSFFTCYCASNATDPADSDIGNVSIGSLNNGNPNPATNNTTATATYTSYSSVTPPVLLKGISYPISVTQINKAAFLACNLKVYIDYNQDGIYDTATEEVFNGQSNANAGGNVMSGNVLVPANATNGLTGMRVVLVEGTFSTVTPCGTYFNGETEDYIVDIQTPLPCSTPPVAGTSISSATSVCPNAPFDLNLSGSANASGLTYQWQESSNGTSWQNLPGATSILYSYSQVAATYYRCEVICSGVSSFSTPVLVGLNSFYTCYCTSAATSTGDDDIGNVTFGLMSNGIASPSTQNPTSVNTYSNFTNLPPYSYIQTLTYPISMTQINLNGFYVNSGAIFIDFDHDGTFDPSTESVLSGTTSAGNTTISGTLTIPLSALTGITGMRVVMKETATPAAQPCGTYTWGETEDYLINILAPNSCTVPFIAGFAKTSSNLVCASDVFTLSIDSLPPDTGFTFQWQQSFDSINWSNIVGATTQIYNGTQSFKSWYRCNVTCNGGSMESSIATKVLNKPVTQCDYCNSIINGNCSTDYFIDSLAIGGTTLNNANTGCAANAGFAYSKYPFNGNTTADLGRGNYYDLYVKTSGSCNISVWIDYDQSGTFDAKEWIQVSQATDSAVATTVPLVLPTGATLGGTGLRIRSRKAGNMNMAADACSTYGSGETEDYFVNIIEAISTGKELSNDKNVRIYPNPAAGNVTLEYHAEDAKTLQVKLLNATGSCVFSETTDKFKNSYSAKLSLDDFAPGIYFVQFTTDKSVSIKKLIIQK
jgi:hypothetical protein